MNPALLALLAEAEQKGLNLAIDCVSRFVGDVMAGKSVADAAQDLAMWAAEQQALALDSVVAP